MFQIEVLKSKIHRVRVTEANLNYVGSISTSTTANVLKPTSSKARA